MMEYSTLGDEKESVYLCRGMTLSESDIDTLARIINRLFEKMCRSEKKMPTHEGTRSNKTEYAYDTVLEAEIESKTTLDTLRAEISAMSRRLDQNRAAHTKIHKEIDEHREDIDKIQERNFEETETGIIRDKRITDIEEFMEDL